MTSSKTINRGLTAEGKENLRLAFKSLTKDDDFGQILGLFKEAYDSRARYDYLPEAKKESGLESAITRAISYFPKSITLIHGRVEVAPKDFIEKFKFAFAEVLSDDSKMGDFYGLLKHARGKNPNKMTPEELKLQLRAAFINYNINKNRGLSLDPFP